MRIVCWWGRSQVTGKGAVVSDRVWAGDSSSKKWSKLERNKARERERTAVEESTGWNVDVWTSAAADLVWLCDGVDGEWSAVAGNHEALTQSGFQADQWVADMWVTLSAAESQSATLICLRGYLNYILMASVATSTLVISCSLHFDFMQRSLLTISHRNRPL